MTIDETSLDRIRGASFSETRKGYDKDEVHGFLEKLADWLESGAGDASRADAVKRELENIGQRSSSILTQAEEGAAQIRLEAEVRLKEAEAEASKLVKEARAEAKQLGQASKAEAKQVADAATEEANELLESARAQAETLLAEAKSTAERLVSEGEARRKDIETVIDDLGARRDEVRDAIEILLGRLSNALSGSESEASNGSASASKATEKKAGKKPKAGSGSSAKG